MTMIKGVQGARTGRGYGNECFRTTHGQGQTRPVWGTRQGSTFNERRCHAKSCILAVVEFFHDISAASIVPPLARTAPVRSQASAGASANNAIPKSLGLPSLTNLPVYLRYFWVNQVLGCSSGSVLSLATRG